MKFTKLTFAVKVYVVAVVSCLLTVGVLSFVYASVRQMHALQQGVSQAQDRMSRFGTLNTYMVNMETGERGYMLSGDLSYLDPYNQAEVEFDKYAREAEPLLKDHPAQLQRLQEVLNLKRQWIEGPAVSEMLARRKMDAGRIKLAEFVTLFKASNGKALTDQIRATVSAAVAEEESNIRSAEIHAAKLARIVAIWAVVTVLVVSLGFFSIGWVTRALSRSITNLVSELSQVAEQVQGAAQHLTKASETVSDASVRQATSMRNTASSMTEVSEMVSRTADNAGYSKNLATSSQEKAATGKESVVAMLRAIEEINESNAKISSQVERSNQQISDIVQIITEIGSKTKVINDIVFQTKLLSFNASVEAARAGEHGKGFSVVAEEVGLLALNSGKAAKEITDMLDQSVDNVRKVISSSTSAIERIVREGKEKASTGSQVAKKCGEILEAIVQDANNVQRSIEEISVAVSEQKNGVSEVNGAIVQVGGLIEQNASTAKGTASSAQQLLAQSQRLQNVVCTLNSAIQGDSIISTES